MEIVDIIFLILVIFSLIFFPIGFLLERKSMRKKAIPIEKLKKRIKTNKKFIVIFLLLICFHFFISYVLSDRFSFPLNLSSMSFFFIYISVLDIFMLKSYIKEKEQEQEKE